MIDRDGVIQLLQLISAYDNRRIDELLVRTWAEAARRARWSFDGAADAIHEHYATSTSWLMPGHITAALRAQKGPAPVAELRAIDPPAPASPQTRARIMDMLRGKAFGKRVPDA